MTGIFLIPLAGSDIVKYFRQELTRDIAFLSLYISYRFQHVYNRMRELPGPKQMFGS